MLGLSKEIKYYNIFDQLPQYRNCNITVNELI